ncbi:MAG: hypothetical protein COX79_04570 [Candidatus Levybacteria bacterium CG_4_10_14_0_2_um_filter_36_16]|nr:MAG: hypothetical protein AUK12_03035 [Candidatus Levybacteria bacterium CG2_30_37_29]PIR79509.1 MAG: hypothetical protein COU26_00765 [Candidatus Levybacteria bacterium CG10_big_fil_rev_8_21_14_0_10_36_30]PIZ96708.1 MAG: hypothetical protein COX79_04570 [Candidatus Levybacteria bacterium CG_4_10_14_0_2_um_filter_36_16]PJA90296.1 MAG: hypothetical protein CO136_02565 [Candidatus Levybacteria bacterium CG_4_9_14_3_um_filter_36_7]
MEITKESEENLEFYEGHVFYAGFLPLILIFVIGTIFIFTGFFKTDLVGYYFISGILDFLLGFMFGHHKLSIIIDKTNGQIKIKRVIYPFTFNKELSIPSIIQIKLIKQKLLFFYRDSLTFCLANGEEYSLNINMNLKKQNNTGFDAIKKIAEFISVPVISSN